MLTGLSVASFSIPLPTWDSTQCNVVSLCLHMYVWEVSFQCHTFWATYGAPRPFTEQLCHNIPSHNVFVLFSQALSGLKISGRLNGGLVQAAHTCGTPLPPGHGKRAALRAVVGLPSVKVATAGVRSCTHRQIPHSGLHVSQTIH